MTKLVLDASGNGLRLTAPMFELLRQQILSRGDNARELIAQLDRCTDRQGEEVLIRCRSRSFRTHPVLISLVELHGRGVSPPDCELRIVEVPKDAQWDIVEFATFEFVKLANGATK